MIALLVAVVLGGVIFVLLGAAWYVYVIAALVLVVAVLAAWIGQIELWR